MNSRIIEKRVEDFLDNYFNSEDNFTNSDIQKKRFDLLSKLVSELFDCKNSTVCVHNISNLIVLILNIYRERFPVDIYTNGITETIEKSNNNVKRILKENLF
ncbi:MAG: hypothetical protein ACW98D_17795 [Promethearchaeota archaeon]